MRWEHICGNCAYWKLISTISVVGYGGKYYGGELKGLCEHTKEQTLENDRCDNNCYRFIGDKKNVLGKRVYGRCAECNHWRGDIVGWFGDAGEREGLCDSLERGTPHNTYCTNWTHKKAGGER